MFSSTDSSNITNYLAECSLLVTKIHPICQPDLISNQQLQLNFLQSFSFSKKNACHAA